MYSIQITPPGAKYASNVAFGDIEVAEFKIPLMSAILSLPTQALVKPGVIAAQTSIQYANGVGAQDLGAEVSYSLIQLRCGWTVSKDSHLDLADRAQVSRS